MNKAQPQLFACRWMMCSAAACGFIAVMLGAFGAHALTPYLSEYKQGIWKTAVNYQMFHALLLLVISICFARLPCRALYVAAIACVVGVVFFSGSLYGLALGGPRWLGPITPIGGLAFMVAWVSVLVAAWRQSSLPH